MPTIRDVAQEAGVSPTTVSRILNDRGPISKKTRDKVYKVMQSLDYQPNEMARSLQLKRTHIIGLIIHRADSPFYARLIQSIEKRCASFKYMLLLCTSDGDIDKEKSLASMLRANKVDGILLCGWMGDSSAFVDQDMPVVTIERTIDSSVPMIGCDNITGGKIAARTLLEGGCRYPIILSRGGTVNPVTPGFQRLAGFKEGCVGLGVTPMVYEMTPDAESADNYMDFFMTLFSSHPLVDGIFCPMDIVAVHCRMACNALGIDVPGQVQIVGFDGISASKYAGVTTIAQPIEDMGTVAFDMLLKRINHEIISSQSILPVTLIKRDSTR